LLKNHEASSSQNQNIMSWQLTKSIDDERCWCWLWWSTW